MSMSLSSATINDLLGSSVTDLATSTLDAGSGGSGEGGNETPSGGSCVWSSSVVTALLNDISTIKSDIASIKSTLSSMSTNISSISSNTATITGDISTINGSLSSISSNVSTINTATSRIPTSPAAVGSAMTLTPAYDAAKTAAPTVHQIWGREGNDTTSRTLTASPTNISGLATASDLSSVASNVSDIKAKTDNLPGSPAASGDAMGLSDAAVNKIWGRQSGSNRELTTNIGSVVWSYMDQNSSANSRTLTSGGGSGGLTAADVWNYGNTGSNITTRTLTDGSSGGNSLTAADVWNYGNTSGTPITSRTINGDVTVSSASVASIQSGLSTFNVNSDKVTVNDNQATAFSVVTPAVDISTLSSNVSAIKTKTDNLPADTATVLSGLSTFNPSTDTVTLGSLTVGVSTIASEAYINSVLLAGGDSGEGDDNVSGTVVVAALEAVEGKVDTLQESLNTLASTPSAITLSSDNLNSIANSVLAYDISNLDNTATVYNLDNMVRASLLNATTNNHNSSGDTLTTLKTDGTTKTVFTKTTNKRGEPTSIKNIDE